MSQDIQVRREREHAVWEAIDEQQAFLWGLEWGKGARGTAVC